MIPPPPRSTLFPYTTLFRSNETLAPYGGSCSSACLTAAAATSASTRGGMRSDRDRKSTRLNSSHANISYAVFCLKKKKKKTQIKRNASQRCRHDRALIVIDY